MKVSPHEFQTEFLIHVVGRVRIPQRAHQIPPDCSSVSLQQLLLGRLNLECLLRMRTPDDRPHRLDPAQMRFVCHSQFVMEFMISR